MADETDKEFRKREERQKDTNGTWGQQETVFMSNNINPFTVMPLSPNQVSGGQLTANILVNTIQSATSGGTIELLSSMNVNFPNTFKYNGQSIYPYQVYSTYASAICSDNPNLNIGQFAVNIDGQRNLLMTNGDAVFSYNTPNDYNMTIDGFLSTSNSVGIKQAADPNYALSVNGNVFISGEVNLAGVQLANLGIGTSVAPGYVFDVSGASILRGITTFTKDAYIQGNLGIGKTNATVALDVLGSSAISNNMTVAGTTFTNRLGVGKLTNWTTPFVMDILGNTYMAGSLAVSTNLDVSGNTRIIGSTTITGQGVGIAAPTLSVIGNISYTRALTGQSGVLSGNLNVIGRIGIGSTSPPQQALDVTGSAQISQNLTVTGSGIISQNLTVTRDIRANTITLQGINQGITLSGTGAAIRTPYIYIGNNTTHIPDLAYQFQLAGAAQFGSSSNLGQIVLNKSVGLYDFDMSGTLNTTQAISSNLYVQNIFGSSRLQDPSSINIYGSIYNNKLINTPKLSINTLIPINELSVTGISDFVGGTNITGDLTVTGNIIQTPGLGNYLSAPTNITVIRYGGTGGLNWSIIGTNVTLTLDTWPMFYVIDGSGTNTDMAVTIQSDGGLRTGLTFNFIGRRTTVGHTIIYPYSSGSTYTKTLISPLSFPLLCIGTNDYSST
jgi:hypothetical protein